MTAYITLGANDCGQSNAFYDAVLPTIGWTLHADLPGWRAYAEAGKGDGLPLWIAKPFNQEAATAGNGTMVGFMVASHTQVDAFYAAVLANGGQDEGAPGFRPQYGPKWYAAYVRDPVGNKLAVVCNE